MGRSEELELLGHLRSSTPAVSAVLSGSAGVGKSRLAREALARAAGEGWATLAVTGSAGFASVPLGPFRTVLGVGGPSDLTALTDAVADALLAMRAGPGLLLLVDDCQELDETSAALVHQLVASRSVVSLLTVRAGTTIPPALTRLWQDGFAERIELQNLSQRESAQLLDAGLSGPLQDSSADRIWHLTGGNPLYLREVVLSARESSALEWAEGEWRWHGDWMAGARLQEIVAGRLGRLDPEELTTIETLALAGPLSLGLVTTLTSGGVVEALEGRGLVTLHRSGARVDVALAHPLHAEVLRSGMAALQQRSIRRNLALALNATGARRGADRVRLACWSLESGLDVDTITLSQGTDASLFGIGQALSARLAELVPSAAVDLPADEPAVHQDTGLAIRLARAAYDRTGTVAEGVALASTLAWTGAIQKAEAVLTEVAGMAEAVDDRRRLALALSWIRFWGHGEVDAARSVLLDAITADGPGNRTLLADVYEGLAGIALNTADPAGALAYAEQSAAVQGVELSDSIAAVPAAAALAYLGRCDEALAVIDQALPAAQQSDHPLLMATLLFARGGALARRGDLEEAAELLRLLRDVALSNGLADATANFGVLYADILLRQGRAASAARIFRDASGLLAERDVFGYRPWALTGLARCQALAGEEESAQASLDEARRIQPIGRHFDMSRYLAEIEVHRLGGRREAAFATAEAAADWARARQMVVEEAQAITELQVMRPSPARVERLVELSSATDSRLVAACAAYAAALQTADPVALLATGETLADIGAAALAFDAMSAAARAMERKGRQRAAASARRRAAELAARCDGRRPAVAAAVGLTPREREVAALAAAGRPSKEIAERMYLSARTVENHLYHAYTKLGVTDRNGLATALAASGAE